jgi:hypothetical protein
MTEIPVSLFLSPALRVQPFSGAAGSRGIDGSRPASRVGTPAAEPRSVSSRSRGATSASTRLPGCGAKRSLGQRARIAPRSCGSPGSRLRGRTGLSRSGLEHSSFLRAPTARRPRGQGRYPLPHLPRTVGRESGREERVSTVRAALRGKDRQGHPLTRGDRSTPWAGPDTLAEPVRNGLLPQHERQPGQSARNAMVH